MKISVSTGKTWVIKGDPAALSGTGKDVNILRDTTLRRSPSSP